MLLKHLEKLPGDNLNFNAATVKLLGLLDQTAGKSTIFKMIMARKPDSESSQ
jgi:ABC-type uncharacterized transport system ATPase subunit